MTVIHSQIHDGQLSENLRAASLPGELSGSYRWHNYWTDSLVQSWPKSRTAFITAQTGEDLVGWVGAYRYPFPPPFRKSWQRKLSRAMLWPANPLNFHGPFQYAGTDRRDEIDEALFEAITRLQRRWLVPASRFVLLDPETHGSFLENLNSHGFSLLPGIADTRLSVVWPDYESYLQDAMLARHRKQLKKYQDRAEKAGVRFRVTSDLKNHGAMIYRLIAEVADRNRCEPLLSAKFTTAAHLYLEPGDLVMVEAWKGDRMIGCTLNYREGRKMTMKSLGMDYSQAGDLNIYRLLITQGIRYAIQQGLQEVRCGCSQYEIKQRLGFRQVQTLTAIRAMPRSLNRLFGYRLRNMRGARQHAK